MTNNPLFQEIEEDLERQKLEALWKRYGSWVIAAAIAVVLGTSAVTSWHSWRMQQEQKATVALDNILSNAAADNGKQIAALQDFAQKNRGETQAIFAKLHAASLAAHAGDVKQASDIYDSVANDAKADPFLRQLADLYAVQVEMDSGDPVALEKRLQPLLADNAPWRYTAMQDAAFLALRAGDKAKAKQLFTELSQDAGAPPTLAARAADMIRFIDE